MLHTLFRGNQPAGSEKRGFLKDFKIYGHGDHLGHVTSIMLTHFHFPVPENFHTKFDSERHSSF